MERAEKTVPVYVEMTQKGASKITLRAFDGYSITINKSLLADNHLEIDENEYVCLPKSLYDSWFRPIRDEVRAKVRHYYKSNIRLFWKYREKILFKPELYYMIIVFGENPEVIRLGVLVELWKEHPHLFSHKCPKCGTRSYIYEYSNLCMPDEFRPADANPKDNCIYSIYCPKCNICIDNLTDRNLQYREDASFSISCRSMSSDEANIVPFTLAEAVDYLKRADQKYNAMEITEKTVPVYVEMTEEGVCEIVLRDFDGYSVTIRKSLLADNRLEIEENEYICLPESLYDRWFKQIREKVQEKKRLWTWLSYKNNIGLFLGNSNRILNKPRLFATPVPFSVYGVPPLTLGIMANAWGWGEFSIPCPKCHRTMHIYNMYGSSYNGLCIWSAFCPDCGTHLIDKRDKHFVQRAAILNELAGENNPHHHPYTLEEAIYYLKNITEE